MKKYSGKYSIVLMAKIFNVSPSGYYSYLCRDISKRKQEDIKLSDEIIKIFYSSQETYGRYRIYNELKQNGIICSQRRVSRLMKENKLVAKAARRFKVTTKAKSDRIAAPNKLNQDFIAEKPNKKWVSDITYIWTVAGWLYLAVVMDLFSRKIIGLAMGKRINKELAGKAFLQAMLHRNYPNEVLYHSDRGSQYTSNEFQQLMKDYKITVSMSGKGNCYDNAAMESFFHTLKVECTDDFRFNNREEAMNTIFEYIEIFYNNKRTHSHLNYLSPNAFEKQFWARK